jgi:hypothetical protein
VGFGEYRGGAFLGGRVWEEKPWLKEGGIKMSLKKAVLKGFNSGDYTATIQLTGSYTAYLDGVAVARNLAAAEMVPGRRVAVSFFDEHNAKDAVVVAVYT